MRHWVAESRRWLALTEITREELAKQIKEYLAKGGAITKVPPGFSGVKDASKSYSFSKNRKID